MEQNNDPNKVRCVKGSKVAFFNRKTASKPSWQKSTGWTVQELPAELTQGESRQLDTDLTPTVTHEITTELSDAEITDTAQAELLEVADANLAEVPENKRRGRQPNKQK